MIINDNNIRNISLDFIIGQVAVSWRKCIM